MDLLVIVAIGTIGVVLYLKSGMGIKQGLRRLVEAYRGEMYHYGQKKRRCYHVNYYRR